MGKGKIFKTGLFGFRKKSVLAYVDSLAKNYSDELAAKEEELTRLRAENKQLSEQNAEYAKQVGSMQSEREYIANAIILAEQEAQRLLEDARKDVDVRRAELEKSLEEDTARAKQARAELTAMHEKARSIVKEYEDKLAELAAE